MDLGNHEWSIAERPWPKSYSTCHGPVKFSKATRRMRRLHYEQGKVLRKINKLLARQIAQKQNMLIRQQVRTLKAEKRKPRYRMRNRDTVRYLTKVLNPVQFTLNPDGSVKSEATVQINSAEVLGGSKWIWDYHPTLAMNPPRQPAQIGQSKRYSTSCEAIVPYVSASLPGYRMVKSQWPIMGCRDAQQDPSAGSALAWNQSYADAALVKALAKVYKNDVNMNEYVVEWRQVLKLLKDPVRTVLASRTMLEHWFNRDAWIWLPQRSYRKLHNGGTLVSSLPLGGVLMSMRTKRTLDPKLASKHIVDAAANRWLQYRYGIAPMAMDITTVMSLWRNPGLKVPTRSESARYWVNKTKTISFSTQIRGPFVFTFKRTREVGVNYSAVQYATFTGEPTALFRAGLDPSQWLRVIWNSIPYSFLADWAIDVDNWLTSQIDVPWVKLTGNCVTAKRFDKVTSTCIKVTDRTGRLGRLSTVPVSVVLYEAINRRIDLPKPSGPPASAKWLKLKNIATALALSLNLIPSKRKFRTTKGS